MPLDEEFSELQKLLAQKDLITESRKRASSGFTEFLLAKRRNMKYKIYQERGHTMPHIHIDYGRMNHAASFAITSGERLDGNLPKKYDSDISSWLSRNQNQVLKIWESLQNGEDPKDLTGKLLGDG